MRLCLPTTVSLFLLNLVMTLGIACSDGSDSSGGEGRSSGKVPKKPATGSGNASGGQATKSKDQSGRATSATIKEVCEARREGWVFDEDERECVKLGQRQSGDKLCSSQGSGWIYDDKSKTCVTLKAAGGTGAEEACKSKGSQWFYDREEARCVEGLETRDAEALCRNKVGANAIFVAATGECRAKNSSARLALSEAQPLALVAAARGPLSVCETLVGAKPGEYWLYRPDTKQCVRIGASQSLQDLCAAEFGNDYVWYASRQACSVKDSSVSTRSICEALAKARANAAGVGSSSAEARCIYNQNYGYGVVEERHNERDTCERVAGNRYLPGNPARCETINALESRPPATRADVRYSQVVQVLGEAVKGRASLAEGSELKEDRIQCPADFALLKMTIQQQVGPQASPAISAVVLKCINLAGVISEVVWGQVGRPSSSIKEKNVACPMPDESAYAFPNAITVTAGAFIDDVTALGCVAYNDLARVAEAEMRPEIERLMNDPDFAKTFDYENFMAKGMVKYNAESAVAVTPFPMTTAGSGELSRAEERSCNRRVEGRSENTRFLYGFKVKYMASAEHPFLLSEISTVCTTVSFTATGRER